jgi:nucleotide-binding universal stress UspA family protein
VHVSLPVMLSPLAYSKAIKQIEEDAAANAAKVLEEAVQSVKDTGVDCRKVHRTGGPAEVIADLADLPHIWGVVVGAQGHNALSRVLLGSIADRLTHICKKPVIVVR